ncbi:hypothetical protein [Pseudomonas sp. Marseille-QA0892]
MLINGYPLGSVPLAGLAGEESVDPVPVIPNASFTWRPVVTVAGVDWSTRLAGIVEVDREEGAAGVASFALCMPPGPVTPTDWKGRAVTIELVAQDRDGQRVQRLYTGRIADPSWDRATRTLACTCSDLLQQRVKALGINEIDALTPSAHWSPDVFQPVEGRSRWDYMNERLGTLTASLDSDVYGGMRVTSWFAKGSADYVFGPGSTVHASLDVQLSDIGAETNVVEIDSDYRFSRLRQHNERYYWQHPNTFGVGGEQGFCNWISERDGTELPDIQMVKDAVGDTGQTLLSAASWYRQLPTGVYCGGEVPWANDYLDLLLGASFSGGRRWVQTVTEQYRLRVVAETSVEAVGEVVSRQSANVEIENERAEEWGSKPFGIDTQGTPKQSNGNGIPVIDGWPGNKPDDGKTGHEDLRDEERRQALLRTLLAEGYSQVISAHRGTALSWQVPTGWIGELDLIHTIEIDDQDVRAKGKCVRLQHALDMASGSALSTVTMAVMRGGGSVTDPLVPPPYHDEPQPEPEPESPIATSLPTQLGGKVSSPEYNEKLPGFSGNYSVPEITDAEFPRRFDLDSREIPAEQADEQQIEIARTYRVAIPNDLLEMT